MQNNEELRLEILRLQNTLADCKAAIKDAIYCAEETTWKKLWVARYSYLLGLYNVERHTGGGGFFPPTGAAVS